MDNEWKIDENECRFQKQINPIPNDKHFIDNKIQVDIPPEQSKPILHKDTNNFINKNISKKDLLQSTDNIKEQDEIEELEKNSAKNKHLSKDEKWFKKVISDGETTLLYDLGPFSLLTLKYILKEAKKQNIPICIVEKKKYEKVRLSKKEKVEQEKYVRELEMIHKHISQFVNVKGKTAITKKKELLKKKKEIQRKLNDISQVNTNVSYHIYINVSRIQFVEKIRKHSYPTDIALKTMHVTMASFPLEGSMASFHVESKIEKEDLKEPGNYGTIAPFYMHGKDYFETHVTTATYYQFRIIANSPTDHIALKYPDIDPVRMIFETNRLIDYVFYLCQAKSKEDEIYIQYVHSDENTYRTLDFSDLPKESMSTVSDWTMPLSFLKLKQILQYCEEKECPVSYRIQLPKGNLKTKEDFKKLNVIIRTKMDLTGFV